MELIKGMLVYHFSINIIITSIYLSRDLERIIKNKIRKTKVALEYDVFAIFKIIGMLLMGNIVILFQHFE